MRAALILPSFIFFVQLSAVEKLRYGLQWAKGQGLEGVGGFRTLGEEVASVSQVHSPQIRTRHGGWCMVRLDWIGLDLIAVCVQLRLVAYGSTILRGATALGAARRSSNGSTAGDVVRIYCAIPGPRVDA